jgi:uncharacterized protein with PIN domain
MLKMTTEKIAGQAVILDTNRHPFVRCPICTRRLYGKSVAQIEQSVEREIEGHY